MRTDCVKQCWTWFVEFRERHPYWALYEMSLIMVFISLILIPIVYIPMQAIRSDFSIVWALKENFKETRGLFVAAAVYVFCGAIFMVYDYFAHKTRASGVDDKIEDLA